ncbi:MAG: phosphoenolpyruvate carboxylase [Chloroflexi bacterium]|nr:phosphoenolpyruvate carboxylase [Chloroflexota bacterium]
MRLVFTAHPSEAKRQEVLIKLADISELLTGLERQSLLPREQDQITSDILRRIEQLLADPSQPRAASDRHGRGRVRPVLHHALRDGRDGRRAPRPARQPEPALPASRLVEYLSADSVRLMDRWRPRRQPERHAGRHA